MLSFFNRKCLGVLISFLFLNVYANQEALLLVVEQNAGKVGFYDPADGKQYGSISVGFLPHELVVSHDQRTAFVSNFGIHDYDQTIGVPGTSVSVIDIPTRTEKFRLNTYDIKERKTFSEIDKAPHGMGLRPPFEKQLYVNVEKGNKVLVFDLETQKIIRKLSISPATHNLMFSPDGKILWLMAGKEGLIRMNPDTGKVTGQLKLASSIRGLTYTSDNKKIILSGNNEVALINPADMKIVKHFNNLEVGQLLYSAMTPDQKYIIAPAVWDSQIIIIDTATGMVIKRVVTGLDPITVKIALNGEYAYVTNARDNHVTAVNLKTFESNHITTAEGPNGLAVIPFSHPMQHLPLKLGVPLPLSGKDGQKGREMMLGYEFWKLLVQRSGGLYLNHQVYDLDIQYLDTQSDPDFIKEQTKLLVNENKVNVLLGTLGDKAYAIEKEAAQECHVLIAPQQSNHQAWTVKDIYGESLLTNQQDLAKQFENYYNLNVSTLSTIAIESGIGLQQKLNFNKADGFYFESF